MKGTVKFFNEKKGFGFIAGENSTDYFFHISNVDNQEILTQIYDELLKEADCPIKTRVHTRCRHIWFPSLYYNLAFAVFRKFHFQEMAQTVRERSERATR